MSDRPIIFGAPMVAALLAGRKTQTRRVIKPQPAQNIAGLWVWPLDWATGIPRYGIGVQTDEDGLRQTFNFDPSRRLGYAPGDRLWVRETWRSASMRPDDVIYRADGESLMPWRSPIHMPRWASRLTLIVTDVRVQRLQEISEDDARAEGARPAFTRTTVPDWPVVSSPRFTWGFEELWESIHGPGAWDANPWVAAVSFAVDRRNIDAVAP